MAETEVWCLLIDHNHKPTFGEPFPLFIRPDGRIHELKIKIRSIPSAYEARPNLQVSTNRIEIWRCKNMKLSAKDSFGLTKKKLRKFKFSEDESSDVQHLGVAQRIKELQLGDDELLLALVPHDGMRQPLICFVFLTELPW